MFLAKFNCGALSGAKQTYMSGAGLTVPAQGPDDDLVILQVDIFPGVG
jgi:hypothetical protein